MFKKKVDLPPRPKFPTPSLILQDLEDGKAEDPVFDESVISRKMYEDHQVDSESFSTAKEFLMSDKKLQGLYTLLVEQKAELEENYKELQLMASDIRQQALDALK